MNKKEAIKWLSSLKDEIGKFEHRSLWNYEQALNEIILLLEEDILSREEAEKALKEKQV